MKKQFLTLAILALALFAKAGNEGPQAVPQPPPEVLAEYAVNGGFFVPPNAPVERRTQILTNRRAIEITYFRSSAAPKVKVIKTLTMAEFAQVNSLIKQIKPGALYDAHPDRPGCQDAPSFSWTVNGPQGTITIAQKYACKEMERKNRSNADLMVMKILNDLAELARK